MQNYRKSYYIILITFHTIQYKYYAISFQRYYSLALEPMEVRRKRIIMLAEAYAIFGYVNLLLGPYFICHLRWNKIY